MTVADAATVSANAINAFGLDAARRARDPVAWAVRLLDELRDDGISPATLAELARALPTLRGPGADVLARAHREAIAEDGLSAVAAAELVKLAGVAP